MSILSRRERTKLHEYVKNYTLIASDPCRFTYNVLCFGSLTADEGFSIRIPYPFVTYAKGGKTPLHVYGSLCASFNPLYYHDVTCKFSFTGLPVIIGDNYDSFNSTATITITAKEPVSGFLYITVQLEYGLKDIASWVKESDNSAFHSFFNRILNLHEYEFSVSCKNGFYCKDEIQNINIFRHR